MISPCLANAQVRLRRTRARFSFSNAAATAFARRRNETHLLSLTSALGVNSGTERVVRQRARLSLQNNYQDAHSLRVFADWERGGRLDLILPGMLRDYAYFHGLLILICGAAAVLRLRRHASPM